MIARILISLCVLFWLPPSSAHEGRPIYVEVIQNSEADYTLKWKIPPVMPTGLEPLIKLEGKRCEQVGDVLQRSLSGARSYHCKTESPDLEVVLSYPGGNPVLSTLLLFKPQLEPSRQSFSGPDISRIELAAKPDAAQVAYQYLSSGVAHLLAGYDHLLFVLCLMWISRTPRRLLLTVTGFTVGHSITLALASLGLVWLPIVFVEVLIALSIVILVAEILHQKNNTLVWRYPVGVALLFGLLHGFGFASVLGDFGLPQGMLVLALLFFNIGIELGQLFFVMCCWLLYRYGLQLLPGFSVCQPALSKLMLYTIGVISAYWMLERFLGLL